MTVVIVNAECYLSIRSVLLSAQALDAATGLEASIFSEAGHPEVFSKVRQPWAPRASLDVRAVDVVGSATHLWRIDAVPPHDDAVEPDVAFDLLLDMIEPVAGVLADMRAQMTAVVIGLDGLMFSDDADDSVTLSTRLISIAARLEVDEIRVRIEPALEPP